MDISVWGVYRTILISPTWQNIWNGATALLVAKIELKDLSISEPFEELLSWNSESKLITPKYITDTYFGTIVAIFHFLFSVFSVCNVFSNPWAGPKAGCATCFPWIHYNCSRGIQVARLAFGACSGVRKNITHKKQTEKQKLKMATMAQK